MFSKSSVRLVPVETVLALALVAPIPVLFVAVVRHRVAYDCCPGKKKKKEEERMLKRNEKKFTQQISIDSPFLNRGILGLIKNKLDVNATANKKEKTGTRKFLLNSATFFPAPFDIQKCAVADLSDPSSHHILDTLSSQPTMTSQQQHCTRQPRPDLLEALEKEQ